MAKCVQELWPTTIAESWEALVTGQSVRPTELYPVESNLYPYPSKA